jgi:hypothetical protein
LASGKHSDADIAYIEKTSVEYVRKVRCQAVKTTSNSSTTTGGLASESSRSLRSGPDPELERRIVNMTDEASIRAGTSMHDTTAGQSTTNTTRSEQITLDQRKELWADFDSGLDRVGAVKKYGYPAATVRDEHSAYSEFENIDLNQSQNLLTGWLRSHLSRVEKRAEDHAMYKGIMTEYAAKKFLTKEQHIKLFDLCLVTAYYTGAESLTHVKNRPPEGWVRPHCSICGKPLHGVLVDSADAKSKPVLESIKDWHHTKCAGQQKKERKSTGVIASMPKGQQDHGNKVNESHEKEMVYYLKSMG